MRIVLFTVLLLLTSGFYQTADAQKLRLRSQITPDCESDGSPLKFADIHADGNIAVQGSYNCTGAFIYDISNPDAPVLSSRYNPGNNQQFLEAIVVGTRGYFGSGTAGGVHIVDLTNPASPQLLGIVNSTNGGGFNSIHEMVIWGNFLIQNFNGTVNKKIRVINISNPAAPVFIREIIPTEVQWVHAMHIRGNRMFTSGWGNSSNRGRTEIYDISNLATQDPTLLGFLEDPSSVTGGNNMHSSWSSEDGNFLYSAREINNGSADLRVYDISNPAIPLLVRTITMAGLGLNAVSPHNPAVVGNLLYVSWYQAGVQVFDISTPRDPRRVAQYDTYQDAFAPTEGERKSLLNAEPWDMVCGSQFRQNALPTVYNGLWAVFPFLGPNKVLAGDLSGGLLVLDASAIALPNKNRVSDFDGDRKTDFSTFTPSTGVWQVEPSSGGASNFYNWGVVGDKVVTGDYDGDGKADTAVWRPSNGTWYIVGSSTGIRVTPFGVNGDVPVPGDYDADGKTDIAVWRPSTGVWYIIQSTLGFQIRQWGVEGDKVFAADYEGDGKADIVVWRPSNGMWYIIPSSTSIAIYVGWGENGDRPLFTDFNGDGRAEYTVFRPSNGIWYTLDSADNTISTRTFGIAEDLPMPADYDGDGKSDLSVFRPSTSVWYHLHSSNGGFVIRQFGQTGDRPSPLSVQPQ